MSLSSLFLCGNKHCHFPRGEERLTHEQPGEHVHDRILASSQPGENAHGCISVSGQPGKGTHDCEAAPGHPGENVHGSTPVSGDLLL